MQQTSIAPTIATSTRSPERLSARLIIAADRRIFSYANHWLRWTNVLFLSCVSLVLLAPILVAAGLEAIARPIYSVFGVFCHQLDDRSFHIAGYPLACCERCFAVYSSIAVFGLFYAAARPRFRKVRYTEVVLLLSPLVIDGLAVGAGMYSGNALLRVVTGVLFGIGAAWMLLPWLDGGFASIRLRIEALFDRLVAQDRAEPL
jgi:uncharacterized membrane protein